MNVAVVALGKIGLPLAVQFASKGHHVVGADVSDTVVEHVNAGRPPFPGESGLESLLAEVIDRRRLVATTDTAAAIETAETVVIVVPLVVDAYGLPDFQNLDAATAAVAGKLRPGTLVSYETTMPVGTTRNRLAPALEAASGLKLGLELFVCHSPERVYSGRIFEDLRRYPKLVGGLDAASASKAVAFYRETLDFDERSDLPRPNGVWDVGSAEAAEFAKLAETTYRDVNIALANEFACLADRIGVDVLEVISAANSQPFSHIHRPGISVGGHCIPVYPRFYLEGHPDAALPAAARRTNDGMPEYAVRTLTALIGDLEGLTVAVLGAAYRGDVKEAAFSGVFGVVAALSARRAKTLVHDPLYTDDELARLGLTPYQFGAHIDAVILHTDHSAYRKVLPEHLPGAKVIVDGRRMLDRTPFEQAGVRVVGIGDGTAARFVAAQLPA